VWTYCLLRANHKATKVLFEGQEILLRAGQFITGRFEGAEDCNMKPSTFRDQLTKLKNLKMLDIKSDNRKSIITVVKWTYYQALNNYPDNKPDNKPTTARHRQEYKEINMSKNDDETILSFNGVPTYAE